MKPNPRSLILNLLLATEGDPLSARDAISSCALFGIRENSVRVTLVRLASAGLIEAAGRGAYRLGPNGDLRFRPNDVMNLVIPQPGTGKLSM